MDTPISIESERAFLAAAFKGIKLRSRPGDGTLDALYYACVHIFKTSKTYYTISIHNDIVLCIE